MHIHFDISETTEWKLISFMDILKCHLLITVTGIKSYEPSPDEMESSYESDASRTIYSDDDTASISSNDATMNEQPAPSHDAAWRNITASTQKFVCTAREQIHYSLPSSSDRDIQPIDVYKLFCTDEVIHLINKHWKRVSLSGR